MKSALWRGFFFTLQAQLIHVMKKWISLFSLVCFTAFAGAQTKEWMTQKSTTGYTYKTVKGDPTNTRFYTLKNGLTVILTENKEQPRIQTIIATKAGSKTDPKTNTGLAHYLEHMLFKGTSKYGSLNWAKEKPILDEIDRLYEQYNSTRDEAQRKQIYRRIDSTSGEAAKFAIANEYDKMMSMIGAQGTNAFTSFEQTAYINDIPSNQIDRWLTVEAERFRDPVLRIFHTELEAVYEEKNRSLDSDDDKVFELLFDRLFQKHNYGQQTTIGTIEHLKNPSLNEIRKYFYNNYVPNNMCIIMAGDLNSDQLVAKIDKAFAYMKPKEVKPYTYEQEAPIAKPIEASVYGPDAEYVNLAFRFPGASSPEAKLLNLMSSVLSNGTAGLMDLNLVKKQQVLSASAGAYILKDYSVLFLEGKAKEGQALETVRDLMLGQIQQIKNGQFEEDMLKAIINNYRKSLIEQQESNSGRAYGLLDAFTSELDWAEQVAMVDAMSKLTKKDIVAFANQWLNTNYVCVYKRIGQDKNVQKVDKPEITPVEVNRDAQSDFVKNISKMPVSNINPVFVNYNTDIQRGFSNNNGNKVEVLSVKNKNNALFSQYYHLSMGSLHQSLLPYALDYLQYLGTKKYTADQISSKFYTLACDFGVSSSDEETYVYLSGLQDNYTEALELFEHLLANCEPNEEALKDMIAGAKKKRADAKLNKNAIRRGLVAFAQYGARNPFNNKLSNEALDQIKAADLIAILRSLTQYPHKVMYYGPMENKDLVQALNTLHPLPANYSNYPNMTPYTYQTQSNNQVLFADYDMVQAEIQWFRNDVNYTPAMEPVQSMFNEYFGGNMSGIVFQEIRESKALAYSTYAVFSSPAYKNRPHTMMAYVGCQADKMKEALAGMQSLIDTLPQSEKLFRQSQQSIKNTISTTRTTKANILFSYLNAQKKGLDYEMNQKLFEQVGQFSFNDIRNFHQQHIAKKPYTLTVVGNDKKLNWSALSQYGPVKKLTLTDIFGY